MPFVVLIPIACKKVFIKDFFSKYDEIHNFLEQFIFCTVIPAELIPTVLVHVRFCKTFPATS